ncbi:hypothetical protein C8R46DRAFT_1072310, partial [Mycena filopes]
MSPTFGKPDPNILRPSETTGWLENFKFKTIGKQPELLKRLSSFREDDAPYQYSPSPEPEDPYPPPALNGIEPRTRPSLLQALTSHESHEPEPFLQPPAQPTSALESPGIDYDMQLQYPETPVQEQPHETSTLNLTPPSPPPSSKLHKRLETSHTVLALPPPPKKAKTPLPDFPRPSLIAANNAVHHTEKTYTSAKEALEASQTRVTTAQAIVDNLAQALLAARASLESAQKSLVDARQVAGEAQSALLASRAAADAAEETKRLLEEPPPLRSPTPEPVDKNAELVVEMKKDLDPLRLWVEEQEAGHIPTAAARRESSRDREEEDEREASRLMITPDDNDTDVEVHAAHDTSTELPAAHNFTDEEIDELDSGIDEPRRLEEDAARALVALAEQITPQTVRHQQSPINGLKNPGGPAATDENLQATEMALAREAALRKQQETRREQVRVQKQHAHAAAALSILKERQDAVEKSKGSIVQSSPPSSIGNVVAKSALVPPATKPKIKKAKPVSGGVKLGPETSRLESPPGLRTGESQFAPNSKGGGPPLLDRNSPHDDEVSASRTGSDPGDIRILKKTPKLPEHLLVDVQLLNLRFALQEEGIPWEAISRSRPQVPGVKSEEPAPEVTTTTSHPTPVVSRRSLPINPPPALAENSTLVGQPLKPLPSRKQLPKFNKSVSATSNVVNDSPKPAPPASATQPQPRLPSVDSTAVRIRPPEAPPASIPPKRSPPLPAQASAYGFANPQNKGNYAPVQGQPLPRVQAGPQSSNRAYGAAAPVQRTDSPTSEPDPRDGFRYDTRPSRPRSRTPEKYGVSSTPSPIPPKAPAFNIWSRPLSPPRARTPSPLRRAEFPAKRGYSGDHYSPAPPRRPSTASSSYPPRHDSPPRGPRLAPRAPSQKRLREEEYTPPSYAQKRFKDDGRDGPRKAASPAAYWNDDRPSLGDRLGAAANSNVHFQTRGESYQDERAAKPEGLLSRLSDPSRGSARGRGGIRGRPYKPRGRGRGERSLADRMQDST